MQRIILALDMVRFWGGGGLEKRGSLVGLNLVVNSPEGDRDRGFLHG